MEAVEKCKKRQEAKAAREEKRNADLSRRAATARACSAHEYAHRRLRDGTAWVNIAAGLKKDYPNPLGTEPWNSIHRQEWDWALAIMMDTYYYSPRGWSF
jgi:hypothetical protein